MVVNLSKENSSKNVDFSSDVFKDIEDSYISKKDYKAGLYGDNLNYNNNNSIVAPKVTPRWRRKPMWLQRVGSSTALIVSLSAFGGLIFGYNTGVIGPALGQINDQHHLNTVQQGLIVCPPLLGALIGSVAGGYMADWIGRKPVVFITAICCIGGAISSACTNPLGLVASLRIILGLGIGMSSAVCPLMVAEVVPVEKRGIYGSVFQLFITIGLLWANVMGLLLLKSGWSNWRWMFGIGAAPGIMMLLAWTVLNESPVWLENKRLQKERSIQTEIISGQPIQPKQKQSFKVLLEPQNRKPMFLGVILCVFAQLTGINAFMYFSNNIFFKAGFTGTYGAITCSCILQFWNVSITVIAALTVDHIGRRPLLFVGSIVMTVADLLIALFYVALTGKVQGWLSIICLFIFVGAFAMSIGTLFWFIVNEIFDPDVKDIGAPILVGLQWLFNMLLSFTFTSAVRYLGDSTMFWIFGGIGVTCVVLLAIFLPPENIKNAEMTSDMLPGTFKEVTDEFNSQLTPSIFSQNRFYNPRDEAEEELASISEIPETTDLEIPHNNH